MAIDQLLLVTDLSLESDRALERTLMLTKQFEASPRILYVLDEDLPGEISRQLQTIVARNIREQVSLPSSENSVPVVIQVERGKGFPDLLHHAREEPTDLVVLGVHQSDPFEGLFVGSTAERFLRYADHPVLLVMNPARRPYQSIVVAMDFSVSSRRALRIAFKLAPEGEVHFVHAYAPPYDKITLCLGGESKEEELSRRMHDSLREQINEEFRPLLNECSEHGLKAHTHIVPGYAGDVIVEQTRSLEADLRVIGTHGRTGVGQALPGNIATKLLDHPPTDILIARAW